MVMGRREGVATASPPVTVIDLGGLAAQLAVSLLRTPFRRPLRGVGNPLHNAAVSLTRETIRSFMGYASSLRINEYRSVELVLDDLCRALLPPVVRGLSVEIETASLAGVPGIWFRSAVTPPVGTVLYLHGGGYIGTSPWMYAVFVAELCRRTKCEVFVADYRLAPEFPFPAGLEDAVLVMEALLHSGVSPDRLFVAGDSGGGGLASTLLYTARRVGRTQPAGALLFSPEVDLLLNEPSVTANAGLDILPWNIPTAAYLHGVDPGAGYVSAVFGDVDDWPPVFVAFGRDEMFRDPIRLFVEHLQRAGVETTGMEEEGMFHVFPILMPWADASRRVFAGVSDFVRKRVASDVTDHPSV